MLSQNEIYNKIALKGALLMALLSVPSLVLSLYGAIIDDAAFGPVMVQSLLFLSLVLAAIPAAPLGYKQRLLITVVVLLIAGAVATLRYANPTIGYTYTIIISLIVTLMLPRLAVYLVLAGMNIAVGVVAVSLFDLTPIRVALQFVTFTGTTAIGLEIIFTLIKYHSQQGEVLAEERTRQRVVSSEANIGFLEFDYESGLLDGDGTNAARFGRSVSDGPFTLSDYAHLFPAESWEITQSMIAEFSLKSVGTVVNFAHSMIGLSDGEEYHYRVTGVNMMRDGRLKFVGVSADVTKEHRLVKQSELQAQRFNILADAAKSASTEMDFETGLVRGNAEFYSRLGLPPDTESVAIDEYFKRVHEPLRSELPALVRQILEGPEGESVTFNHAYDAPDGSVRHYRVSAIKATRNGRTYIDGVSIDITEVVNALVEAKDLTEQIDLISKSGGIGLIEFFPETQTFKCNPEVSERLGLDHESGERPIDLFHAHQLADMRQEFLSHRSELEGKAFGELQRFTHPFLLPNGEQKYYRVTRIKREQEGRESFLGLSIDITEELQAKERAERQSAQLGVLTEKGQIGLYEFDLEREVMHANSVLCERFGLAPDAGIIDIKTLLDAMPEESRFTVLSQIERGKRRQVVGMQSSIIDQYFPDGSLHKIRIYDQLIERDGRPFFVGASVDVTEEVAALESAENALAESHEKERLLNLAYSVMDLAVAELDVETGKVRLIAGASPNKSLFGDGVDFWKFFTPVYGAKEARQIYNLFEKPGSWLVLQGKVNGIPDHWAKVGCSPEYKRNGRCYRSIYRLIVDELVEARHEAEINERALRQQQDRQAQMYAVIGHELRTPAASLQMMLDDLGEGESLNSELVGANIEQLLSVIDTLRAVAQPDRMAKTAFADVQMDEMLQQQAVNFQTMAQRQGMELRTDLSGLTGHPVSAQKTLLRQVVGNLIKNALIHSQGSEVVLRARGSLLNKGQKHLQVCVEDNGNGIPEESLADLFKPFARGSTEAEGTGLGLHVCREIIDGMGGTLEYEPNPSGGSRFVIELDLELASHSEAEAEVKEEPSPFAGLRVLVAEDNKTIQMLTQKMLSKQGAQVQVADNGALALTAYRQGEFDLILSDIFMPVMNGYQFVAALREQGYRGKVIGLTAATIGEETDKMIEAGADTVLSKPINLEALKAELAAQSEKQV